MNALFILQKSDFAHFFHGAIVINVHVIICHWKRQPFFYLKQFLIFIQPREKVMIFLKTSYKKIRVIFPLPSYYGEAFVERPSNQWVEVFWGNSPRSCRKLLLF